MLIRLSPSGPPIANSDGGTAEVGEGFLLRMSEGTTIIDSGLGSWTPAQNYEVKADPATATAPFLRPELANPSPNRRYRVTGAVDLENTGLGTATITSTLEVSYDSGATWDTLVIQESEILFEQTKHVRIDQPLTLGSALNEPITDPPPASLMVRLLMRSNIATVLFKAEGGTSGAAFLQLTEHL